MDARLSTGDRCDPGGRSCAIGSFGLCTFGGLHVTMRPNIPRVYVAQRDPGNGCWVHGDCLQIPIEQALWIGLCGCVRGIMAGAVGIRAVSGESQAGHPRFAQHVRHPSSIFEFESLNSSHPTRTPIEQSGVQ